MDHLKIKSAIRHIFGSINLSKYYNFCFGTVALWRHVNKAAWVRVGLGWSHHCHISWACRWLKRISYLHLMLPKIV